MQRPSFEEALNDISARMGLSPIELLQHAMRLRCPPVAVELEPSDDYCDEQCDKAQRRRASKRLEALVRDVKK